MRTHVNILSAAGGSTRCAVSRQIGATVWLTGLPSAGKPTLTGSTPGKSPAAPAFRLDTTNQPVDDAVDALIDLLDKENRG
ncbi:MAG: hypothetical protein ABJB98_05425 [Actinomycetota bacterium]